jgi:hypothetical protein
MDDHRDMEGDQGRHGAVRAARAAIDARSDTEARSMTEALARKGWPAGLADRAQPSALEWVRRWGPTRVTPPLAGGCSCPAAPCAACN